MQVTHVPNGKFGRRFDKACRTYMGSLLSSSFIAKSVCTLSSSWSYCLQSKSWNSRCLKSSEKCCKNTIERRSLHIFVAMYLWNVGKKHKAKGNQASKFESSHTLIKKKLKFWEPRVQFCAQFKCYNFLKITLKLCKRSFSIKKIVLN